MTRLPVVDWNTIQLVVFDVDGTLYDQRRLRARMALELARDALARHSATNLRILSQYRALREEWAERDSPDFERELRRAVANRTGLTTEQISAVVTEWIDIRPLRHMLSCRFAAINSLFDAIRQSGRTIAVHSDYPVAAKLAALGLDADHIASAGDPGHVRLKPHSSGLSWLMSQANAAPHETLMIGDRLERDGVAAQRAGTACLLKSHRAIPDMATFQHYDDPVFAPLLR